MGAKRGKQMKTIYIDCTSSVPIKNQPFHGGRNYIYLFLLEMQKRSYPEHEFILLFPTGYSPGNVFENLIYNNENYKIQHVKSLSDNLNLNEDSTFFLPLLYRLEDFKALRNIKHTNPTVRLIATVHDLRNQFNKYGSLSRYYYTGLAYHFYFLQKPARWLLNTFILNPAIRRGIRLIDTIFTISNYSLQEIMKQKFKGNIIPYFQTIKPVESNNTPITEHKYFLFVSGNRAVKNLLRTLEAFCLFKKTDENEYYLYVTGMNEQMLGNFLRYKKIDKNIVEKWVRVFGYVDDTELDNLYKNCSILLFTSLAEGFGLPILEAAQFNKPSISSYTSSIPEVLGGCTHYINPYDVISILKGMEYMSQKHIINQYETWLSECYPTLENRIKIDMDVIIHHITCN